MEMLTLAFNKDEFNPNLYGLYETFDPFHPRTMPEGVMPITFDMDYASFHSTFASIMADIPNALEKIFTKGPDTVKQVFTPMLGKGIRLSVNHNNSAALAGGSDDYNKNYYCYSVLVSILCSNDAVGKRTFPITLANTNLFKAKYDRGKGGFLSKEERSYNAELFTSAFIYITKYIRASLCDFIIKWFEVTDEAEKNELRNIFCKKECTYFLLKLDKGALSCDERVYVKGKGFMSPVEYFDDSKED